MAGASRNHNLICTNLVTLFSAQLRDQPCYAYASEQRVKVPETTLYTYPDLVISCGPEEFLDEQRDTLLNPVFLVEVLSASTQTYDRGAKFSHYRTIGSVQEYWAVHQDEPWIEQWSREGTGWRLVDFRGQTAIAISTALADVKAPLTEVYRKVIPLL